MTFLWPEALWLLLLAPALVAVYVLLLRRKKRGAVRYASLSLVQAAIDPRQWIRRHVPAALFLAAMIASIVAVARPTAVITLPSDQRTVILAIDVSLSMRATDVEPNRLAAAQEAAKAFIEEQPADVRTGIVSFAGTALLVQAPTQNREDLVCGDRPARAPAPHRHRQRHHHVARDDLSGSGHRSRVRHLRQRHAALWRRGIAIDQPKKAEAKPFTPVPPGSYASAAIVLLSDGRRTTGPDPLDAAKMAADRGVRVFTVGLRQRRKAAWRASKAAGRST